MRIKFIGIPKTSKLIGNAQLQSFTILNTRQDYFAICNNAIK